MRKQRTTSSKNTEEEKKKGPHENVQQKYPVHRPRRLQFYSTDCENDNSVCATITKIMITHTHTRRETNNNLCKHSIMGFVSLLLWLIVFFLVVI